MMAEKCLLLPPVVSGVRKMRTNGGGYAACRDFQKEDPTVDG